MSRQVPTHMSISGSTITKIGEGSLSDGALFSGNELADLILAVKGDRALVGFDKYEISKISTAIGKKGFELKEAKGKYIIEKSEALEVRCGTPSYAEFQQMTGAQEDNSEKTGAAENSGNPRAGLRRSQSVSLMDGEVPGFLAQLRKGGSEKGLTPGF